MKFLHLADLHIGKRVNGFSMLEDQRDMLAQLVSLAQQQKVDAILIAGDIYDKTVPVCEAVGVFDSFLTSLWESDIRVLAISGNHDSPERLDFASTLLEKQGVSIVSVFRGTLPCVTLTDERGPVHFFLFPFVKPAAASGFLELEEHTSQCVTEAVLGQTQIPTNERTVLLAHLFVTEGDRLPERSESEIIPIGGLDTVDVSLFSAFDYVALGHLHRPQKIGRETVRYAGSPLKYSVSEARYSKTVPLITMGDKGELTIEYVPLSPLHDLREVRGALEDVIAESAVEMGNREDYLHVTLTDDQELYDPMGTLERVYPNIMKLDFDNSRTRADDVGDMVTEVDQQQSVLDLFSDFFSQVNGKPLEERQLEWMTALCEEEPTDETD